MSRVVVRVQGLNEAIRRYSHMPQRLRAALVSGMSRAVQNAVGQAKQNASGRPGPRVDTGRLRSSINGRVLQGAGHVVGVIGTNVVYARVLEFGFNGSVHVKAHSRRGFAVRAHDRRMRMPELPYLRPAVTSPFARAAITHLIFTEVRRAFNG